MDGVDDSTDRRRVLQVAAGGRGGQQQMVAHDQGKQPHVGRPQPEPLPHPGGQLGADHTVIAAATLADVVQQRAQYEQVGPRYPGGECACARDSFDQMTVNGPGVHRIPRRQVAHRSPFREKPAPQAGTVQRLNGGHRGRPGAEQHQQVLQRIPRPGRPRSGRGIDKPREGGGRDRDAGGGGGGRDAQDQPGVAMRFGVAGQHHLTGVLHDTFVEWTADRTAQGRQSAARTRIGGGAQTRVDVVADGTRGVGEHAGQVEPVADAQRRADLIGILRQQLVPSPFGHPMQLGSDVHQRQVCRGKRARRRVAADTGVNVRELPERQRIEQLHVTEPAHPGLEIWFGTVGDLAAALPTGPGLVHQFLEAGGDSGAPLPPRSPDQLGGELIVAGDVPGFEHRQPG